MMTDARGDLQTLQAGRGLAALAVLIFHTNGVIALPKYFGADVAPWSFAGDSGVDYFFVLSGFVMTIAHWGQIGDGQPRRFWWRRARRLVPALWVVLTLSLGAQVAMGLDRLSPWDVINGYLILPTEHEALLAVEWTLRHEVIFYALFGLMIWRRMLGAILLGLWFLAGLVGFANDLAFPAAFWFSPTHLEFALGCAAGVLFRRDVLASVPTALTHVLWITGGALFLGSWIITCDVEDVSPFLRPFGFGLGAALLIVGLATLEKRTAFDVWGPLRLLGDASYSIYLIHFLLLSMLAKIAVRLNALVALPPGIWWAFIAAGALAGGVIFYAVVERPLLKAIPARLPTFAALRRRTT